MKKIKNRKVLTAIICSAILLAAGGCRKTEEISSRPEDVLPKIVVGGEDYPPFNYMDVDGTPAGIDVDMATEAFKRMGYQPEFAQINWEEKKSLLESGKIDCIWCSFSMNGREGDYNWAGPYMLSRQVVAVNPDSEISALSELEGKTIAIQATTKPEEIFLNQKQEGIPKVGKIFSLQNRELIYPMLSEGYVDAVAAHEISIRQYMRDYEVEYRILEEPLQNVGLGVAFAREDTRGLDRELNHTLAEMKKDGTLSQIIGKYLENPDSYLEVGMDEN